MIHRDKIPPELLAIIDEKFTGNFPQLEIPPPVFTAMKGEFISTDIGRNSIRCKFPVLNEELNPYGHMQGGIISAAIDNTIGPLSMIVAAPNVTRKMEVKYLKPIPLETGFIWVNARFIEEKKRFLFFEASVENETGDIIYATSKSTHYIVK